MFSTLATLVGVALIFLALCDVFHQLFRPSGAGGISGMLMHSVWRAFRPIARRYPSVLTLAGPAALIVIIASWVSLVAVGWALVYWARLPEQFLLAPGLKPSEQTGFVDALYFSLVTLTTLGFGNIAPTSDWLRVLAPLEGLLGFGLLTASLTWVVSIYPPLTRRRSLAQQGVLIREAESESGVSVARAGAQAAERRLESLTCQLTMIRSDLSQFPITYYFHSGDERSSLPAHMQDLLRIAQECAGEDNPAPVRLGAAELRGAIDDFCSTVASQFPGLPSIPADRVLAAYARDHLRASPKGGGRGKGGTLGLRWNVGPPRVPSQTKFSASQQRREDGEPPCVPLPSRPRPPTGRHQRQVSGVVFQRVLSHEVSGRSDAPRGFPKVPHRPFEHGVFFVGHGPTVHRPQRSVPVETP